MKHVLFPALIALLAGGCSGAKPVSSVPGVQPMDSSDHCGLPVPGLMLIESEDQAELLVQEYSAPLFEKIANADFANESFLVVAAGQQNTAGHQMVFSKAAKVDRILDITVNLNAPESQEFAAQVITTPCMVVKLPADGWSQLRVSGANLPSQTITSRAPPSKVKQ